MNKKALFSFVAVMFIFLVSEPALAGPGGKIASAAFDTLWGKVILGLLVVIFLPLICYVMFREKIAERRARKDLAFMSVHNSQFDWMKIQERAKDCFFRVHSGWRDEDLSGVSEWMDDWYWQNQQLVHLNGWKQKGLKNICDVKKIVSIKPILFVHRNQGQEHEQSMIVIAINAKMKDYLEDIKSGKVVEGSKRYKEVETVWSLTMFDGSWKVSNIEEGSMSLAYAKHVGSLPKIESTLASGFRR